MPPEWFVCAATGSNARIYRLNSGLLAAGRDADIVLLDAPAADRETTALDAIKNGDIAAVCAVITDGVPRFVGRSRNTPSEHPPGARCGMPRAARLFGISGHPVLVERLGQPLINRTVDATILGRKESCE